MKAVSYLMPQKLRKLFLLGIIATLILFIYIFESETIKFTDQRHFQYPNYSKQELDLIKARRQCFQLKEPAKNLQLFDDLEKRSPSPDKSIFFTITTCLNSSRATMKARYLHLNLNLNSLG